MFCKYCGKEIVDNSAFCKYCGANLKSLNENFTEQCKDSTIGEESSKTISHESIIQQEETKYNNGFIINLLVAIFAIITIFFVLHFFNSTNNNSVNSTNNNMNKIETTVDKSSANIKDEKTENKKMPEYYYETYMKPLDLKFKQQVGANKNNDALFHTFKQDYFDIISQMNQNEVEPPKNNDSNYWIKTEVGEGSKYIGPNYRYLQKQYGKYISSTYNQWLIFTDNTEHIIEDGGLMINPDKLRIYIIELENLVASNRNFVEIEDVKNDLNWYLQVYTQGLDNTPIFKYESSREINSDYKVSYEKFLDENKDSKYYPMIEELYQKLQVQGFKYNEGFDVWSIELYEKYVK